jgi:predicted RND superfamily exporter protein
VKRSCSRGVLYLAVAAVAFGLPGCSKKQAKNETVAQVNDDAIKVAELREFLGVREGATSDSGITAEQKKEALDRLIAGRLLAQDARAQKLDDTDEFRDGVKENEKGAYITALLRKEIASSAKVSKADIEAEAKKMKAADNTLSDSDANARAKRSVSQANLRKVQEKILDNAKKEFPPTIHQETVDKISGGETVPDDAVLANVDGDNVTYGYVKGELERLAGGRMPDVTRNPLAINRMLTREVTGKSIVAYAKKQGIEASEWFKITSEDIERTILIDLLVNKIMEGEAPVSDKEVDAYYQEHPEMFAQQGKTVPLAMVKDRIQGFLRSEKRRTVINAHIEELKKKAKITVNEKALGEV